MNVKGEKKKSSKMYTAFTVDEYLIDSMKKKSAGLSLFFMSSKGMEMHRPEERKKWRLRFFVIDWNSKPNIRKKIVFTCIKKAVFFPADLRFRVFLPDQSQQQK